MFFLSALVSPLTLFHVSSTQTLCVAHRSYFLPFPEAPFRLNSFPFKGVAPPNRADFVRVDEERFFRRSGQESLPSSVFPRIDDFCE